MEASPTFESPRFGGNGAIGKMLLVQPDAVLCRLAARGNTNAYEVLYRRYHQPVFAFVFHLLNRRDGTEDAEDIAQESFTKAFDRIGQKSADGSFKSWIFTIARNRTFDDIRGRGTQAISLDAETVEAPAAAPELGTAEQVEHREELAWLVGAVGELPERQRDALLMRELGGMSHSEIADQLGTSVSATKKLISRGRDGVQEAASDAGFRSRRLGRELAMAAPILPVAAAGVGLSGAAAGAGGAVVGGKVAATLLTVVAIGGGAAVAERHTASAEHDGTPTAEKQDVAGSQGNAVVGAPSTDKGSGGEHANSGHHRRGRHHHRGDSTDRANGRHHGNGHNGSGGENESGDDNSGSRRRSGHHDSSHRGSDDASQPSSEDHSGSGDSGSGSGDPEHSGSTGGDSGSGSGDSSTPPSEHSGGGGDGPGPTGG
ncbi:MAG: RNA polymerase sigma factor [Solirubrobacterales bacterium]